MEKSQEQTNLPARLSLPSPHRLHRSPPPRPNSPTPQPPPSPTLVPTITPTPLPPTPVEIIITATPEPTATALPRTLTICMGAEPDTLYLYGGSMLASANVLEAIYDGPIDTNGYSYQPVILEKIPNLADGDATIQPVTVSAGDPVLDADGNPVPLAEGVIFRLSGCRADDCEQTYAGGDVEMDQLSVSFTLLAGLKWADGEPLTAQDSVYSFELASDPETPISTFDIERTASYIALDARTVQWVGVPGFLDATYQTNFWHPLPEHIWHDFTANELLYEDVSARTPLGWGPYIIEEWEPGRYILLRRNSNYFRAAEGLPKFDTLIYRFTGENSLGNLAKLLSGECDLLEQNAHIDDMFAEFLELDEAGELQLITSPGMAWEHLDFGIVPLAYDDGYQSTDRPDFFGDPRTRQALAMCLDRKAAADAIYLRRTELAPSYVPASHPLFNPDAAPIPYNPEQGKRLLEEIGWIDADDAPTTPRVAQGIPHVPNGTPFSITYRTTTATVRQQTATLFAENLAQCGVQVTLEFTPPDEYFTDGPEGLIFGRAFDLAQFAWLAETIPSCGLYLSEQIPGLNGENWSGNNVSGYASSVFDAACHRALALLPGEPGYADAHREAQAIFAEDLPVIPLYYRLKVGAARADFCGFALDPTARSDTWNIEAFDFGVGCN